MEFRPDGGYFRDITCTVGLTFHGDIYRMEPRGIVSDPLVITVLPEAEPATT